MSSSARFYGVPGAHFSGAVVDAGETASAEQKPKRLPDDCFRLLLDLPPARGAEEQAELNALISERFLLNQRTQAYVDRKMSEMRAGLEKAHEESKAAVRAQLQVVETLKEKHAASARDWHSAKGRVAEAQTELNQAQEDARSLSRFANRAAIESAQKKIVLAQAALDKAREPEGESLRGMNYVNMSLLPRELEKLDALIVEEQRLQALLDGRDPVMQELGLQERV
jgi:hypothetical protein